MHEKFSSKPDLLKENVLFWYFHKADVSSWHLTGNFKSSENDFSSGGLVELFDLVSSCKKRAVVFNGAAPRTAGDIYQIPHAILP